MSKWWENYPWRMVQTNLREIDMTDIDAVRYVEDLKEFSANIAMINVGGIIASYPTKLSCQHQSEYLLGDSLEKIIEGCHKNGIKVIARVDFSKIREDVFEKHPEWASRKSDGSVINYNGNVHACLNGGYQQEAVFDIVKEIVTSLAIDGIFFNMGGIQLSDYSYNYVGVCHCEACKEAYRKTYGEELPDDIVNGKVEKMRMQDIAKYLKRDETSMKYLTFMSKASANINKRMREFIKELNPNIAIAGVDFERLESNTEYKYEPEKWQYPSSTITRFIRGIENEIVPSNCTVDFEGFPYRHIAISPYFQKLRLQQSLANLGNVDYYLIGRIDNHEDKSGFAGIKEMFAFAKEYEEVFLGLKSKASTLLVKSRGFLATDGESGFIRALTESHVPFDEAKVQDVMKADLSKYKLIVICEDIPAKLKEKLDEYVYNGGKIIATNRVKAEEFKSLGVLSTKPSKDMLSSMFKCENALLTDSNDVSIILCGEEYSYPTLKEDVEKIGKLIPPHMYGPPERCYYTEISEYPCVTVNKYGKGEGIYVPWNPSEIFFKEGIYNLSVFLRKLLTAVAKAEPLGKLTPMCETQIAYHEKNNALYLQIVNTSGFFGNTFYEPLPVYNAEFTVNGKAAAVKTLKGKKDVSFMQNGDKLSFIIDKIDDYECVEIKLK